MRYFIFAIHFHRKEGVVETQDDIQSKLHSEQEGVEGNDYWKYSKSAL